MTPSVIKTVTIMSRLNSAVMPIRGISLIVTIIPTRGNALDGEMGGNIFRRRNVNEAKRDEELNGPESHPSEMANRHFKMLRLLSVKK